MEEKNMFDNELLLKNETFLPVISSFSAADKYFSYFFSPQYFTSAHIVCFF